MNWLEEEIRDVMENDSVSSNQARILIQELHPDQFFDIQSTSWTPKPLPKQHLPGLTGREASLCQAANDALETSFPLTVRQFIAWTRIDGNQVSVKQALINTMLDHRVDELVLDLPRPRILQSLPGGTIWKCTPSASIGQISLIA